MVCEVTFPYRGVAQLASDRPVIFTLWLARHFYKKNLMYQGFVGTGKQVRDVLHPVSLKELTSLCSDLTGNFISIENNPCTHSRDIPFYVTDFTKATQAFGWKPKKTISEIAKEVFDWISKEKDSLAPILV